MSDSKPSRFQSFKEGQMTAWKQVLERLDKLETKVETLEQKLAKLEGEKSE